MNIDLTLYSVTVGGYYSSSERTEAGFLEEQKKYRQFSILKLNAFDSNTSFQSFLTENRYTIDKDTLADMLVAGLEVKVEGEVKVNANVAAQLSEYVDRPIQLKAGGGDTYNNKCEVHMPGQALSMYNDILLLEDSCSDTLQEKLCEGWRIIACCPQPDQRRPDYILGRFNPNRDLHTGAER